MGMIQSKKYKYINSIFLFISELILYLNLTSIINDFLTYTYHYQDFIINILRKLFK